jgi:2,4-dienoyl-CoA reductase-like NADH-dependent reductase (Old Yellow Enzyme family)
MHPLLFSPIRIGSIELKNRIVVAPHGTLMAREGLLTDEYIAYEIERAQGGAGLLIMSYGLSDPMRNAGLLIDAWRRENIEGFRAVVTAAHRYDCRVFFQFGQSAARVRTGPVGSHLSGRRFRG